MKKGIVKKLLLVTATVGIIASMACSSLAASTVYFNVYKTGAGTGDRTYQKLYIDADGRSYVTTATAFSGGGSVKVHVQGCTPVYCSSSAATRVSSRTPGSGTIYVEYTLQDVTTQGSVSGNTYRHL